MPLQPEIAHQLPEMVELFKHNQVSCAAFFGSCLKNNFRDESDVDLLVEFPEQIDPLVKGTALLDLQFNLENLLHRKVDLISYSAIQNPLFLSEVNETRLIVYGKSNTRVIV